MSSSDIFLGLLAILFPPIAVWIKSGICTADSLINLLLCTLGYVPGLLHAWYIISLYPESEHEYETLPQNPEAGNEQGQRVTYYYVGHRSSGEALRAQGAPQGQSGYGTLPPQQQGQPQYQQSGGQGLPKGGVPPSYEQAVQGDNKVQR